MENRTTVTAMEDNLMEQTKRIAARSTKPQAKPMETSKNGTGWSNYEFITPGAANNENDKSIKTSNLCPTKTKQEIYLCLSIVPKNSQEQDHAKDNLSQILKTAAETNNKSDFEIFDNTGVLGNARWAGSSRRWPKIGSFVTFCTVHQPFNTAYRVYGSEHCIQPISNVAI
mmetsp:Transcript_12727/g.30072  ORF Transcript_12727/g.30072 Transcript_12727/m.30072 type:complete len:171 (+) Transcript_12727:277-789(+)